MFPLAADRIRILHLSDLHFIGKLTERGTRLGTRPWLTKSHDFAKLQALVHLLTVLGPPEDTFHHLVVTGDVSTDGAVSSLSTAKDFIQNDEIIDAAVSRLIAYGLACDSERRTVIPGNHDRYGTWLPFQRRQRHFEEIFDDASYPRVQVVNAPRGSTGPDIIFFIFDSTQVLRLIQRRNPLDRIARGEVSLAECTWLVRTCSEIARTGYANGVSVDPGSCVRIALLHHHPVLPHTNRLPPSRAQSLTRHLTRMDNDEAFQRSCLEAGINMVLFGHQHFGYRRTATSTTPGQTPFGADGPVHFFCCASTSEYSVPDPGFFIYDVGRRGVDAYEFGWDGCGFTRKPTLTRLPFR